MDEKKLWDHYGAIQKGKSINFGPYYSYQFWNTPRHILFTLSRYKFAMKMIGTEKKILELGCNEGLGSYYLSEFASHVHGIDFDEGAISWATENLASDKLSFQTDNFLDKEYGKFDAVVSFDVLEHIYENNEGRFLNTVTKNLSETGIFIIGTPNIESERFSNKEIAGAHVNLYSGDRLVGVLNNFFNNVFLFSQNDEMIHTGFAPMAHYLLCLCCYKKIKKIRPREELKCYQ